MISYRSSGLFTVIVFFAILLLILSTTPEPAKLTANLEDKAGSLAEYIPRPKLPKLDDFRFNLLPPAAHKPPEQKNSTGGGSKWYSHWQWLNPFSSSITLDEDRSVLPPLRLRLPVYTYYDAVSKKNKALAEADRKLLLAWRRACFQSAFSSGISVLKPFPDYTTALVGPGVRLATLLAECMPLQMPPSCPPNNPKCQLCTDAGRMKIAQPDGYKNSSALFTIGIIPHPYTLSTLRKGDDNITAAYIRRETERDPWLIASTKQFLGLERDATSRVVPFKDVVAGDHGVSRGLWFTVEMLPAKNEEESLPTSVLDELDWHFGFVIPRKTRLERTKEKNVSSGEKAKQDQPKEDKNTHRNGKLSRENELIEKARNLLRNDPKNIHIKSVTEAWNLADTEVWRFVRAYRARSVVERKKWEEEEKGFAGS
ncbi:hypothetical protein CISG_06317 [Coccidioides immitis RMSCC 3703]|uniref:Uncharacterized protein n=1 Tax=Coccidioides immitis RMSCC 3703 TaxID=454286 RepID=A0A0J8QXU0_COCIT|nr:hypothetical protein CISG_06317 [Coccidioides immitis RMSCC 3703]